MGGQDKGGKCRSRLVGREIKRAKDRGEQLGPEDVLSPMSPSEGLKMLVSTMMTGHDDGKHAEGPSSQVDLHIFLKDTNRRVSWLDSAGACMVHEMQRPFGETLGRKC